MKLGTDILISLLAAFAITVILCPIVIPLLQRLNVAQTEREEGVKSHLKKAGTPTMGGLCFLAAIAVTSLFFIPRYPRMIPVLLLIVGFGIIGFLDDFLKVVKRRSDGLFPRQKMLGQFLVTSVFIIYILVMDSSLLDLLIPFSDGKILSADTLGIGFRIFTVILAYFAIIGTVNGVNFTDGLDGLAGSVTAVVAVFFTAAALTLRAASSL